MSVPGFLAADTRGLSFGFQLGSPSWYIGTSSPTPNEDGGPFTFSQREGASIAAAATWNFQAFKVPATGWVNKKIMVVGYIVSQESNTEDDGIRGMFVAFFSVDEAGTIINDGPGDSTLIRRVPADIEYPISQSVGAGGELQIDITNDGAGEANPLRCVVYMTTHVREVGTIPGCFVAGTLVQTPLGPVGIEALKVGDTVWAYSHARHRVVESQVLHAHVHEGREIWALAIEGADTLRVTDSHPFWVEHRNEYIPVGALEPGMEVRTALGKTLVVVGRSKTDEIATVFNIKVADQQNYFVGDRAVLVHNK